MGRELGTELYTDIFSFGGRRRRSLDQGDHHVVQFAGLDSARTVLIDLHSRFYGFEDTLFVQRRNEYDRHVRERAYLLPDRLLEFPGSGVGLFHQIPFVHQDDDTLIVGIRQMENVHILRLEPLRGIYDEQTYVRILDRAYGTHYRIKLKVFLHFILLAQPGGIHQVKTLSVPVV